MNLKMQRKATIVSSYREFPSCIPAVEEPLNHILEDG
jgi:hypothetical protein